MKKSYLNIILMCNLMPFMYGCDPIYGVEREAIVTTMPNLTCVKASIEATAGVSQTTYVRSEDKEDIFGSPMPVLHSYIYANTEKRVANIFSVSDLLNGRVQILDRHDAIGIPPPQPEVDLARPLMSAIEANIAKHCDISDLQQAIKETCTRVRCS